MKTVVIGGTFNPVHIGHLYLAEEVRKQLKYERIIFVPTHIPAHKKADDSICSAERLRMLQLATEGTDILVEDMEIRRGGVSYMIDTINELESKYNVTGKIGMVIGDDLVPGLDAWKRWEELKQRIDLVIAHRNSTDEVECQYQHCYMNNLIFPVSSSDIRERVAEGLAYRFMVPEEVFRFIEDRGLYRVS